MRLANSKKMILQHPIAQAHLSTVATGQQLPSSGSDEFASAVAAFKEDGQAGRHDPEWTSKTTPSSFHLFLISFHLNDCMPPTSTFEHNVNFL